MTEFTYVIKDEIGIHARPAGLLVKAAKQTGCKVVLECNGKSSDAAKLFGIMGMAVKCGDSVKVTIDGENEAEAKTALEQFFAENL